jgi:hypothetical protein
MKKIKILAVFVSALLSIYATNAGFDNMVLGGTLQQETVDFTIANNGASTVAISYIVIQDNVLMLTGETTLNPSEIKTIQVEKDSSGTYTYRLEITEKIGSGETGPIKTHSIQG